MRPCSFLLLFAVVLTAARAAADTGIEPKWRPELALRVAYAVPYGHYENDTPNDSGALSTDIKAAVPLTLEAGARRAERLYLGAGATWGRVLGTSAPPYYVQNDGNTLRLAAHGRYEFRPGAPVRPWAGLAGGVEWVQQGYVTYFGFPYLAVDAGVAIPVRDPACLGPFVGASLGRFQHVDGESTGYLNSTFTTGLVPQPGPNSRDIAAPAWHGWIELGVRGCLSL